MHPNSKLIKQGRGTGAALLTAAEDAMRADGIRSATLDVFAANAPGIAFYRRRGWSERGEPWTDPRFDETEITMGRELG